MKPDPASNGLALEVVRGRAVGRVYPLPAGSVVLGNEVGQGGGIDLSEQEGDSPRRMAGRQAVVERKGAGSVVRDLDSPGGTFVNRRRLLPGQDQAIGEGDVIQIGGVQLKVVSRASPSSPKPAAPPPSRPAAPSPPPAPPPPQPHPAAAAGVLDYRMPSGESCRSWDDFLTVSTQRWAELRDELTSGRLARHLAAIGRSDLAPRANAPGTPDDRLDAWLGSLPTTKESRPELDVHPRSIAVRVAPGGRTRRSIRVSNVGYRVLRSSVKVEPADAAWLSVAGAFAGPFATVDETEVTVEVAAPEDLKRRLTATLVVDGNGGSARVAVTVEPPSSRSDEPPPGDPVGDVRPFEVGALLDAFSKRLAGRSAVERLIGGAVIGLGFRAVIGLACGLSGVATLPGPAVVFGAICGVLGAIASGRRGSLRDVPAGGFAGAFAGLATAAAAVACCEAIEPLMGSALRTSLVAAGALWAAVGAAIGGASVLAVPAGKPKKEAAS